MKAKVNSKSRKTRAVKNLHPVVKQNISKPSSASSIKSIAGKLRSLSIVLNDIAKDKHLLKHQGWKNVGNGVWKLKENDFQHAAKHIKGRRKPAVSCFKDTNVMVTLEECKLKSASSIESVSMVTDLRSKKPVGNEEKTSTSYNSSSEAEVVKICVYGAGVIPQESNMTNERVEKSIKVNLSRQMIGPSGEMGWRIRRRDILKRDPINPGKSF